ncbi:M23 family metallopeptidase [Flavobacteriaceae bacterium S0825]|uniref:M23 family metallopeptidase n=1 Tax=Gaetbulibacter sp. S0825 TaxID=2720084 RepID=UPI0014310550|nr:M23 family metallopeptidase [Gaetbulibacter sp. S0825]MCK0109881.1 M23 family metallopeptidase [Flavobacteriaceae bacterium S0825]NIX65510.1 M23 family metallopeptidase [Gaetbulibacter sp. S0825]
MAKSLIIVFIVVSQLSFAQNPYPQDYFRNPLDVTLVLSGTFAELRSNHFHSGLDIKTQQREGLKVYTAAAGYISRIKISHWGYGKALYITHPNGYTTVYAHLQKFAPKIEAYIKKLQYEKESYEIEVFPKITELLVDTDEVIAYSGNTGGSGGPHLHFEIRDNKERPINPMLFGIDVKDSKRPMILGIYAYPIGQDSHVNNINEKTKLRIVPTNDGDYTTEAIDAFGKIGFGVVTYDQQDLAANKNGVSNIQAFYNGNKNFEIDFKRFSFSETKHLNRLIDYAHFKEEKSRIQKLFVEKNNPLSMYNNVVDDGYIIAEDSTASVYKLRVSDYKGNDTWVTIPISGKKSNTIKSKPRKTTQHFVYADQSNVLEKDNISVYIPSNTFYDDFFIDFDAKNDTLTLHESTVPAQKNFTISFDISRYQEKDKDKLFIARKIGYKDFVTYSSTKRKGNILSSSTKTLGTYTLSTDVDSPKIRPINFQDGKWLSKYRYLKMKITDDVSGIKNYRATINGKWILMEYDYKKNSLIYDFNDNIISETKNNLKIIVTDNVGNSSTFEATFFRK